MEYLSLMFINWVVHIRFIYHQLFGGVDWVSICRHRPYILTGFDWANIKYTNQFGNSDISFIVFELMELEFVQNENYIQPFVVVWNPLKNGTANRMKKMAIEIS